MSEERRQQRILVVDDAPANIRLLGEALRPSYQVVCATSGEAALRQTHGAAAPDLILLDITMPGLDGYEVCRRLKEDACTRDIPVIFITARREVEDETRGLELGAVDYITKPYSLAIVRARVRTHLELKRHRDMLQDLSSRDGLTGIPNRRRFDEALRTEWLRAARDGGLLSLIMADIDHFKEYNDAHGHLPGDDCLRRVAGALARSAARAGDLVARYGGEEFACILPGSDAEAAVAVAERMRAAVAAEQIPHGASAVAEHVTVSLGATTTIPSHAADPTQLLESADRALYLAKEGGRDQTAFVEPGGRAR